MKNRRIALSAAMTALALVFSYVESLIPLSTLVPGMKLGLPNIVIVVLLYTLGPKYALIVNIMRILLAGFLFGNPFSIAYALSGGLLSFLVMVLLKRTDKFSIIGVSAAAGAAHNLAQVSVAVILVKNLNVFSLLPALTVVGLITGIVMGIVAKVIITRIHRS